MNLQTPPLLEPDFSIPKFQSWKNVWDDYAKVARLDRHDQEEQLAVFRNCLSLEMRAVLMEVIGLPTSSSNNPLTIKILLDRIQDYFRSKRNIALDCVAFDNRKQHAS